MRAIKVLAVAAFIAVLGAVLAIPVLLSDDESDKPDVGASPTEAEGDDDGGSIVVGGDLDRLASRYPSTCLQRTPAPDPPAVAAFRGGRVSVATDTGGVIASFRSRAPIAWSPSGRYLATGSRIVDADGGLTERLPGAGWIWGWSPAGDCLWSTDGAELRVVVPEGPTRTLLSGEIRDFAIHPSGRRAAVAMAEQRGDVVDLNVWWIDLASGRVRLALSTEETGAFAFAGWGSDDRLYFALGSGRSIGSKAVELRALDEDSDMEEVATGVTTLAHPGYVQSCPDGTVVIAGESNDATEDKRLVRIDGRRTEVLTPGDVAVASFACSPGTSFMVAIVAPEGRSERARRLMLLRADGSIEEAMTDGRVADHHPIWGPRGSGVVFLRRAPGANSARVWFIPEGRAAGPTALTVALPPSLNGYYFWDRVLDWSAVAPSGLPVR